MQLVAPQRAAPGINTLVARRPASNLRVTNLPWFDLNRRFTRPSKRCFEGVGKDF